MDSKNRPVFATGRLKRAATILSDPANRPWILGVLCAFGLLLRLQVLLGQRTLWLDEAHLATAIAGLDWQHLLRPLDNDQVAPFGFLAAAKFFTTLFSLETGLRLPAFIAGVAAVLAAWRLVELKRLEIAAAVVFLALVAGFKPYLYYSFEFKQYGLEFFWGIAILCCFEQFRRRPGLPAAALLWICGLLCVVSAMPAPFILLFPGLYAIVTFARARNLPAAALMTAACISWGALYLILVHLAAPKTVVSSMSVFWSGAMLPAGSLLSKVNWLLGSVLQPFEAAGFQQTAALAAAVAIAGFANSLRRDAAGTWVLVVPLALAYVGALFHVYPFTGRLLLFAMPGVLLLVAEGVSVLLRSPLLPAAARGAVVALLLIFGFFAGVIAVASPTPFAIDTLPKILRQIDKSYAPGQTVYVASYAQPVFRVYRTLLKAPSGQIVWGHDPRGRFGADLGAEIPVAKLDNFSWYMSDLETLSRRDEVWFVFSNLNTPHGAFSRLLAVYVCGLRGSVVSQFETGDSAAYLCRFDQSRRDVRIAPEALGSYAPIHQSYRIRK